LLQTAATAWCSAGNHWSSVSLWRSALAWRRTMHCQGLGLLKYRNRSQRSIILRSVDPWSKRVINTCPVTSRRILCEGSDSGE
jgi:hypothetical protein